MCKEFDYLDTAKMVAESYILSGIKCNVWKKEIKEYGTMKDNEVEE